MTEIFDQSSKEMGIEPVKDVLKKSATQDLAELSTSIRNVALNFRKQNDGQTMLIIRCWS